MSDIVTASEMRSTINCKANLFHMVLGEASNLNLAWSIVPDGLAYYICDHPFWLIVPHGLAYHSHPLQPPFLCQHQLHWSSQQSVSQSDSQVFHEDTRLQHIPRPQYLNISKHRKNCECCPVSLLIVRKQRMSWIHVLNCQNSNQCLNCQNSLR